MTPAPHDEESLGALLSRLLADARALVLAEIQVFKAGLLQRIEGVKVAAILAVAGVTIALASFVALLVGLVIALGQVIGALGGALVVGLGGMAIGGLLIWIAVAKVKAAGAPSKGAP